MQRWIYRTLLLAVLLCPMVLSTACGSGTAGTIATGQVRIPLSTTAPDGQVYRLSSATLRIQGGDSGPVTVETDRDAYYFEIDLDTGVYNVTLRDGWVMERRTASGSYEAVDAVLVSDNPQQVVIEERAVTTLVFTFEVGENVIAFGQGRLRVQMAIACAAGLEACAGECVDLASSNEHCGSCGNACAVGTECVAGVCQATCESADISSPKIRWQGGAYPSSIVFEWTVACLDPTLEYWVYPHVGFTENGGPFGSSPEDEAQVLEDMYDMAITRYAPAQDGTGSWNWYGQLPTNPTGQLALLAYDPLTETAYVADLSGPIDTSEWGIPGSIDDAQITWQPGGYPSEIVFSWSATGLDPAYAYWVYPHVGFTENGGPFGSSPEDEAQVLEDMYDMAITRYAPAQDGTGSWNWYGDKPSNPSGELALLAYDLATEEAYLVDLSGAIDTSSW